MRSASALATAGSLLTAALLFSGCGQPTPVAPAVADARSFTPVLSVKELMEHIVDPIADWIFDAAVVDVSEKGTVETLPLTDEDWTRVERGALILAESANLLKMPRTMVPRPPQKSRSVTTALVTLQREPPLIRILAPGRFAPSSTRTDRTGFARRAKIAVARPAAPAPTTTTSAAALTLSFNHR